jgi:hypothetical protein
MGTKFHLAARRGWAHGWRSGRRPISADMERRVQDLARRIVPAGGTDPVTMDFESLRGRPAATFPMTDLLATWKPFFPVSTATNHATTNHRSLLEARVGGPRPCSDHQPAWNLKLLADAAVGVTTLDG